MTQSGVGEEYTHLRRGGLARDDLAKHGVGIAFAFNISGEDGWLYHDVWALGRLLSACPPKHPLPPRHLLTQRIRPGSSC